MFKTGGVDFLAGGGESTAKESIISCGMAFCHSLAELPCLNSQIRENDGIGDVRGTGPSRKVTPGKPANRIFLSPSDFVKNCL
jgi:hypothetical protein